MGRKSKRNSLVTSGKQHEIIWQLDCTEAKEQTPLLKSASCCKCFWIWNVQLRRRINASAQFLKKKVFPTYSVSSEIRKIGDFQGQDVLDIVAMKWIPFKAAWMVLSFTYVTVAGLINQTLSCHSAMLAQHHSLLCFPQSFSSLLPLCFSPQYCCRGASQHLGRA